MLHLGRRRPAISTPDQLPFPVPRTIDPERVVLLGRSLTGQQPLFDEFTDHAHIDPDRRGVMLYVTGGPSAISFKGLYGEAYDQAYARRQRQREHRKDQLQKTLFIDLATAQWRRASLDTVRRQIGSTQPLDPAAATAAADAVVDFGYTLHANYRADTVATAGDRGLAEHIIGVGNQAETDPTILADNPQLLRLTQLEQKARVEYWQPRFEASVQYTGERLPRDYVANQQWLQTEIERLAQLI
jgi:hypothetical protein